MIFKVAQKRLFEILSWRLLKNNDQSGHTVEQRKIFAFFLETVLHNIFANEVFNFQKGTRRLKIVILYITNKKWRGIDSITRKTTI